jgi:hypothetical protein
MVAVLEFADERRPLFQQQPEKLARAVLHTWLCKTLGAARRSSGRLPILNAGSNRRAGLLPR